MVPDPAPDSGRREPGVRVWAGWVRAAWWALSGRVRIVVEGPAAAGALLTPGWRAGHLGLVQAGFAREAGTEPA